MTDDGQRLAALEAVVGALREDIGEMKTENLRTRTRLHNLEGFAQAYLDVQKENRRQEERQYRKVARAIQLGGLAMAAGMLILTAVTIYIHIG